MNDQSTASKRIYVGLSGGVDSAVTAALLKEKGHTVTGVFIRTWHPEGFPCSEGEDEREAMRVAAHLDIPFKTLDLSERYKEYVAKQMIEGYAKGETPNPDVLCNREVKFGGFVDFAKKEGADAVATGHYARLVRTETTVTLHRGVDVEKDQSYFLALVPSEQLAFALFPLGEFKKSEVRTLAKQFDLPNADRKDSQGICFLGALDLHAFLSTFIPLSPGAVLSESGEVLGTHRGAPLYTVGERHGFSVEAQTTATKPMYVLQTDIKSNTIVVGAKENLAGSKELQLREVNVLADTQTQTLHAQVRYHGALHAATARALSNGAYVVELETPALVAPGQLVALYDDTALVLAGLVTPSI